MDRQPTRRRRCGQHFLRHVRPGDRRRARDAITKQKALATVVVSVVAPEITNLANLPKPNEVTDTVTINGKNFSGRALGRVVMTASGSRGGSLGQPRQDSAIEPAFRATQGRFSRPGSTSFATTASRAPTSRSPSFPTRRTSTCRRVSSASLARLHGVPLIPAWWAALPTRKSTHPSNCCFSGDSGTDRYTFPPLKNGWIYVSTTHFDVRNGQATSVPMDQSSDSLPFEVRWEVALHRTFTYQFFVTIRGIPGLPFN